MTRRYARWGRWWWRSCRKETGDESVTAPSTSTGAVERASSTTSSSARAEPSRWMLLTGRPGTTSAAAREEPMNCSRHGIDVAGRLGTTVGTESTSSSKSDGVFSRKRTTWWSKEKVQVRWTRL